ncbi:MAG: nucleotidyltransferase family protein [Candidatus Poribacteria bacterium]
MKKDRINLTKEQIADFCKKNHIKKFAFFGSVLLDDFRPDSDIDVLVTFDRSVPITFLDIAGMEIELSEIMGKKVDLLTPGGLSQYFRDKVIAEAEVQYEQE